MHALAKLGQLSLRTLAPKQVAAELVFELPNGASERRLRHIAPFGSPGEIQLTGRRQEISDLLHFHSCSLPLNCERRFEERGERCLEYPWYQSAKTAHETGPVITLADLLA